MKITVLGTGMVGQSLATRLSELGHDITMGTRNPEETKQRSEINQMTGESFASWFEANDKVTLKALAAAALDADLIINATSGKASIEVLNQVGSANLEGKILLDIANPLDFSDGTPPSLFISNTDSLGEEIQRTFPSLKVVKSLNTMSTYIMMHPESISGEHDVFVSGNDDQAKAMVKGLLEEIGWKTSNILDLGDITTARGTEMLLPIWLRLWGTLGHANFNFHIQQSN